MFESKINQRKFLKWTAYIINGLGGRIFLHGWQDKRIQILQRRGRWAVELTWPEMLYMDSRSTTPQSTRFARPGVVQRLIPARKTNAKIIPIKCHLFFASVFEIQEKIIDQDKHSGLWITVSCLKRIPINALSCVLNTPLPTPHMAVKRSGYTKPMVPVVELQSGQDEH